VADARDINFDWLLRLRWGLIAGQALVLLLAHALLALQLPYMPLRGRRRREHGRTAGRKCGRRGWCRRR
jgi:hypothetical protein